jgi:hypothetical protein
MAGRIDAHTSVLLNDGVSLRRAMAFHLQSRVYPPRPVMLDTALRAVRKINSGQGHTRVRLPEGVEHVRFGRLVPCESVVEHLNLWCFLDADEEV